MNNIYDIWFSSLNISNKNKLEILEKYNTEELWILNSKDFIKTKIKGNDILEMLNNKNIKEFENWQDYMIKNQIKLISIKDDNYPEKLKNIEDSPAMIYVAGDEKILDDDSVGIVGCRVATNYGRNTARIFAKQIADRNINIVSGLAIGIDKYAHLGALDSKIGKTIAVLGTSVAKEELYPLQNLKVYERILEKGGAIVSEYCFGVKPEKEHFPARNRIISGLSDKIIVVEAKRKSRKFNYCKLGIRTR